MRPHSAVPQEQGRGGRGKRWQGQLRGHQAGSVSPPRGTRGWFVLALCDRA